MDVVLTALRLAVATARHANPRGSRSGDRANFRAALDVCFAIVELATGSAEAEANVEWCELRETVIAWAGRFRDAPRAWWWSPHACALRCDALPEISEAMIRQGQADIAEWCASVVEGMEGQRPSEFADHSLEDTVL